MECQRFLAEHDPSKTHRYGYERRNRAEGRTERIQTSCVAKFKIDDMFDMLKAGLGTHPKLALADLPLPKKRVANNSILSVRKLWYRFCLVCSWVCKFYTSDKFD